MSTITVSKLGAWSLSLGPVVALAFFLIQPGGLLVARAASTDAVASITSLASNAALSKITALLISLGLVVALYGLFALQEHVRGEGAGDALARYGILFLMVAMVGWILAQGMTLVLAGTQLQSSQALQAMVPVYAVLLGVRLISTFAAALGYLILGAGLLTGGNFNKPATWVLVISAIVALVGLIASISSPDQADTMITITRACYFVWVLWSIIIGLDLLKKSQSQS